MTKRVLLIFAVLLVLLTACSKSNGEVSDITSVDTESTESPGALSEPEESGEYELGRSTPEEVIEAVVGAQYNASNIELVSLFSEFIKIGRRGDHPEYNDRDIANLMGMTNEIINEYRYRHFLEELIIDQVNYIELDSEFAVTVKSEYEAVGLDFSEITQIAEVMYTVEDILEGVSGSRSETNHCAEIDGKWYLLYWEGNLYGE